MGTNLDYASIMHFDKLICVPCLRLRDCVLAICTTKEKWMNDVVHDDKMY